MQNNSAGVDSSVGCPAEPQSGVRLIDATPAPAYAVCIVVDKDGAELARGPAEVALRAVNQIAGAVSVLRESDRAVLAVPTPIPAPTVSAWLAKLAWMHQS